MGFSLKLPDGFLPVFSVDTEEQAKRLIVMTCPTDIEGNYYSRELAQEQTLANLQAFSDKLARAWQPNEGRKPRRAAKEPK